MAYFLSLKYVLGGWVTAIVAFPDKPQQHFWGYNQFDSINKAKADKALPRILNHSINQRRKNIALFKSQVKLATVKEIQGAHHAVHLSNPEEVEKMIREFIE